MHSIVFGPMPKGVLAALRMGRKNSCRWPIPILRTGEMVSVQTKEAPNAHKRESAERAKGVCPASIVLSEANSELDVSGPMRKFARAPDMREPPSGLAVTEWGRRLRGEYVHSRRRYKPSVMGSGAAMVRCKGDSFLCSIPGISSQEEAHRLSLTPNPFGRLQANDSIPAEQACVSYNCLNQQRVKRRMGRVTKHLGNMSESIRPLGNRVACKSPESAPARKLHIPIIGDLVKNLDYAGKSLTSDSVRGMPILGRFPQTTALPSEETPFAMDF